MEGEEKYNDQNNFSVEPSNIDDDQAQLRRKERFKAIIIASAGTGALILGLVVFFYNLNNPFLPILAEAQRQNALEQEIQRQQILAMQTQDTDQDGLSDYAELNIHKTSPYLADSDGDGINDKAEVDAKTDPNCPEGQSCFGGADTGDSSAYVAPNLNGNLVTQSAPIMDAKMIRDIMKQSGIAEETINGFSDQEIMDEFAAYLNDNPDAVSLLAGQGYDFNSLRGLSTSTVALVAKTGAGQPVVSGGSAVVAVGSSTAIDLKTATIDDLKNLTGAQIRQLMMQNGASASLLASVTDDQLKEMFLKQLEVKTTQ